MGTTESVGSSGAKTVWPPPVLGSGAMPPPRERRRALIGGGMKDRSERTWHPRTKGEYLLRITRTKEGLFVSSLLPVATREDDARPMTRRERIMWRLLRRPPKAI